MIQFRAVLAVNLCKAAQAAIRILHRGGTAMPGKIAMKLYPKLAGVLAQGMDMIVITGTNGKTSSARMVETALETAGIQCVANRSGANLLSGITTELARNATFLGRPKCRCAVLECDEAAMRQTAPLLHPHVILVTNLFRDQLDRYGEVTHTLENIRAGVTAVPDALLCLNADCSLTASLAENTENPVRFYGFSAGAAASAQASELSDATHCTACHTAYAYDYVTYGHLGGWYCPGCGRRRPEADVSVEEITAREADYSDCILSIDGERRPVRVNLPADYNIYNAAGMIAAVTAFGVSADTAVEAAGSFQCGFGRMEKFTFGDADARMMLVKNPAGCCRVLDYLKTLQGPFQLVVCLNDKDQDGTDVSWIWDADFELLPDLLENLRDVTVGGTRAHDMAMRIKYAGVPPERIHVIEEFPELAEAVLSMDVPVYMMPNYTSMLALRSELVKRTGGSEFWEG